MVVDASEEFYFKPDAGRLLVSPADATPSPPTDAQPEDIDIAIAVDRVQKATSLEIQRIEHRWAGLRSFVDDHLPVAGPAIDDDTFFWLAAQGGNGIMTAPALAWIVANAVTGNGPHPALAKYAIDSACVSPARLS